MAKKATRKSPPARKTKASTGKAGKKKAARKTTTGAKKTAAKKTATGSKKKAAKKTTAGTKKKAAPSKKKAAKSTARGKAAGKAPAAESRPLIKPARKSARKARLTKRQREKFRALLLEMREEVSHQISFLGSASLNKEKYDVPSDNGDEFEREAALNLVSSEQAVLNQIEEALKRIENGSYGVCESCGECIQSSRLEALPFAEMCIECKSQTERGRRRFRPMGTALFNGFDSRRVAASRSDDD